MNLNELKPNPDNPRIISEEQFKKLKEKIKRNPDGLRVHKILYKDGIIIAGNQRFRALTDLGMELKDEWFVDGSTWTDDQIREWLVTSNVSDGQWDFDLLANQYDLGELASWGLDLPNYHNLNDDMGEIEEFEDVIMKDNLWHLNLGFKSEQEMRDYAEEIGIILENNYKRVGKIFSLKYPFEERRDLKNVEFK